MERRIRINSVKHRSCVSGMTTDKNRSMKIEFLYLADKEISSGKSLHIEKIKPWLRIIIGITNLTFQEQAEKLATVNNCYICTTCHYVLGTQIRATFPRISQMVEYWVKNPRKDRDSSAKKPLFHETNRSWCWYIIQHISSWWRQRWRMNCVVVPVCAMNLFWRNA